METRARSGMTDLQMLLGTWESLGILVHRHEIDFEIVNDFYSGSIVPSWRKLEHFVEELRAETNRETRWEWFQWLAERIIERESSEPSVPAQVAQRAGKARP